MAEDKKPRTKKTQEVKGEETLKLKIMKLKEECVVPKYATEDSACMDLTCPDYTLIRSRNVVKIPLGFAMEVPKGYHAKIFLRSSTGIKTRLRLANQTGIIDSDYRGEVALIVENNNDADFFIEQGTRIAQMMIEKNIQFCVEEVDALSDTDRGEGGFGSTGK